MKTLSILFCFVVTIQVKDSASFVVPSTSYGTGSSTVFHRTTTLLKQQRDLLGDCKQQDVARLPLLLNLLRNYDTDDIIRETAGVEEPEEDDPAKTKKKTWWGFHPKGPYATKGHLIEKDNEMFDNLERHHEKWAQPVQVHEIKDVDPVTLTALMLAALVINFFIFANVGDLGLAKFVAAMGNYFSS